MKISILVASFIVAIGGIAGDPEQNAEQHFVDAERISVEDAEDEPEPPATEEVELNEADSEDWVGPDDLSSPVDPAAGYGCRPGSSDYECHNHCKTIPNRCGGYCDWFTCTCYRCD